MLIRVYLLRNQSFFCCCKQSLSHFQVNWLKFYEEKIQFTWHIQIPSEYTCMQNIHILRANNSIFNGGYTKTNHCVCMCLCLCVFFNLFSSFFCLYARFLRPIYLINFSEFAIFSKYFHFFLLPFCQPLFFLHSKKHPICVIFLEKESDFFSCAADLITLKRQKSVWALMFKLVPISTHSPSLPLNKWGKKLFRSCA